MVHTAAHFAQELHTQTGIDWLVNMYSMNTVLFLHAILGTCLSKIVLVEWNKKCTLDTVFIY